MKKFRVVVCGTKYGWVYLSALISENTPFRLVGIIAKGSLRSQQFAKEFAVPLYRKVDELPPNVDIACVVVRSTIAGGEGTNLALQLMRRGIHVIQEHPVHHGDVLKCLKQARDSGVCYHLNSHYVNVEPITTFIDYIQKAREHMQPLFVDATASVQTAYSLIDILGRALSGFSPYGFTKPVEWESSLADLNKNDVIPFQCLQGIIRGVPITIKLQNYYDPANFDNYFLIMHRICIGMTSGNLTLVNTHGPVVWSQTFFVPGYEQQSAVTSFSDRKAVFAACTEPTAVPFTNIKAPSINDIAVKHWPSAIRLALSRLREEILTGLAHPGQSEQYLLDLSEVWVQIMRKFGPSQQVSIPKPSAPFPDPLLYKEKLMI